MNDTDTALVSTEAEQAVLMNCWYGMITDVIAEAVFQAKTTV